LTPLLLLLLFLTPFLTFLPSVRYPFIDFDDDLYVSLNPHVLTGLSKANLHDAFTTRRGGYYIPLTWLSFQLDATLAPIPPDLLARRLGPDGDLVLPPAAIYHLDNTLQHAFATCLLFLFLLAATHKRWPAFAAALLWSIHPLRVESVAWITERKDTLAILFAFLAFYLYIRQVARPAFLRFLATTLAFTASLLAKPLLLMFPFLLLLLDYWPLGRFTSPQASSRLVLEKLHLFAIAALVAALTFFAQHEGGATSLIPPSPVIQIANAAIAFLQYLRLDLFPLHLSLLYPYNLHPSLLLAAAAILLLIFFTALTARLRRHYPHLFVGWLWFLLAFVPMIGLVQAGEQAYADRFTLLPSVGLFILLAYSLPFARRMRLALFTTLLLATLSIGLALHRLSFWRSSALLLQDALRTAPDSYAMHYNLALALMRSGDAPDAAAHFTRAAELNPDFLAALPKALAACRASPPAIAVPLLFRLVQLNPQSPEAHDLLAATLLATGRPVDALPHAQAATRLAPANPAYRTHLTQTRSAIPTSP
jgi:Flp pilus assembly protein TadD